MPLLYSRHDGEPSKLGKICYYLYFAIEIRTDKQAETFQASPSAVRGGFSELRRSFHLQKYLLKITYLSYNENFESRKVEKCTESAKPDLSHTLGNSHQREQ